MQLDRKVLKVFREFKVLLDQQVLQVHKEFKALQALQAQQEPQALALRLLVQQALRAPQGRRDPLEGLGRQERLVQ